MLSGAFDRNNFAGCPVHGFPLRVRVDVRVAVMHTPAGWLQTSGR
jgi:hypothetical protein